MLKCKVLCNAFEHGVAYGKKGDEVTLPQHIALAHSKGKNPRLRVLGEASATPAAPKATKKKTATPAPAAPAKTA